MSHSTTTLNRIVQLEQERLRLLGKTCDTYLTPEEQQRFKEIRSDLDQLWGQERAARVLAVDGPPRLISDDRPMSYTRPVAYGIAPLPSGGER